MSTPRLVVVLPAKDPGSLFEQHLGSLLGLATARGSAEIIVVDDGSTVDDVAAVTDRLGVRLISFPSNRGKGAALRAGFSAALGDSPGPRDLIGFIDSDGDIAAEWVFTLADALAADPSLVAAVGSKDLGQYSASIRRRVASSVFSRIVAWLMPTGVRDTQVGVKVFTAGFLADVLSSTTSTGFLLDVELLAAAHRSGRAVRSLPVPISLARASSTISRRSVWDMFTGVLALSLRTRRGSRLTPLR